MKTKLLFFLFLPVGVLLGQTRAIILEGFGYHTMSPAGQDTIYFYYQNQYDQTFGIVSQTGDQLKNPAEIRQQLGEFFQYKLSAADWAVFDGYWQKRQELHHSKTLGRAEPYLVALDCQKVMFSEVEAHFRPLLQARLNAFSEQFSLEQLETIRSAYDKSLARLRKKGSRFLAAEAVLTQPIIPHIYDYLAFSFQTMERIPSSYYYNLIGARHASLSFIDEWSDNAYLETYAAFEDSLINRLEVEGCRAHISFPFYHHNLRNQAVHSKRNAAFYAIRLLDLSLEDNAPNAMTAARLDTLVWIDYTDSQTEIAALLNPLVPERTDLEPYAISDAYTSSYLFTDGSGEMQGILAFQVYNRREEKTEAIQRLNQQIRLGNIQVRELGETMVYWSETVDQTTSISSLVLFREQVLEVLLMGESCSIDQLMGYLGLFLRQ